MRGKSILAAALAIGLAACRSSGDEADMATAAANVTAAAEAAAAAMEAAAETDEMGAAAAAGSCSIAETRNWTASWAAEGTDPGLSVGGEVKVPPGEWPELKMAASRPPVATFHLTTRPDANASPLINEWWGVGLSDTGQPRFETVIVLCGGREIARLPVAQPR